MRLGPPHPRPHLPPPPRTRQFYHSGVIDEDSCCQDLNHGVLAVGYEDSGPEPHFVIKNSWGDGWGEQVCAGCPGGGKGGPGAPSAGHCDRSRIGRRCPGQQIDALCPRLSCRDALTAAPALNRPCLPARTPGLLQACRQGQGPTRHMRRAHHRLLPAQEGHHQPRGATPPAPLRGVWSLRLVAPRWAAGSPSCPASLQPLLLDWQTPRPPILLPSPSFLPQVPSFCGWFGWTECPARSACVCNFDLFGLLCLNWGCQAA